MVEKRIETAISRTAEWTCLSRAISSLEKNDCYRSDDTIAVKLLPDQARMLIRVPLVRTFFSRIVPAKGMYEYVIARTKYIDSVFKEALANHFDQILIFGAGFDTRALRFQSGDGTRIFELDAPTTQEAKILQYEKRGMKVPSNVTFIPVDFDKEVVSAKLGEAGFKSDRKTLFILEGLLMYLQPESVYETFQTIQDLAGEGSEVVFDYVYAHILRHENLHAEERKIIESVAKEGERWYFGIEKGNVEQFLATYGLILCDQRDATQLEQMYFMDVNDRLMGHVNGTHCLARAVHAG